ncbi:unnamed protein product, partial [Candidula unifasciata]
KRGINIASMKVSKDTKIDPLLLTALESHNPTGSKVHINEDGVMFWPVIFFYPEYAETDFIHAFNEQDTLYDHLIHMFGPEVDPPSWDLEHKLYKISPESTLLKALQNKKYIVYAGTPGFILVVKGSKFQQEFLNRYKK